MSLSEINKKHLIKAIPQRRPLERYFGGIEIAVILRQSAPQLGGGQRIYQVNFFTIADTINPIPPTIASISTTRSMVRAIFVPVDTVLALVTVLV